MANLDTSLDSVDQFIARLRLARLDEGVIKELIDAEVTKRITQKRIKGSIQEFVVRVGYGPFPAKSELLWRFHPVSKEFEGDDWEEHESCQDIDCTPGNRTFVLRHFGEPMTGEQVIATAAQEECRVATKEEAIAFAERHPNLFTEFSVTILGSTLHYGERGPYALVLGSGHRGQYAGLYLDRFDLCWNSDRRFLFVRLPKKAQDDEWLTKLRKEAVRKRIEEENNKEYVVHVGYDALRRDIDLVRDDIGRTWADYEMCKDVDLTPGDRRFVLRDFDEEELTEPFLEAMTHDGLRLATRSEAQVFTKAYPKFLHEYHIFCHGFSVISDSTYRSSMVFDDGTTRRWFDPDVNYKTDWHYVADYVGRGSKILLVRKTDRDAQAKYEPEEQSLDDPPVPQGSAREFVGHASYEQEVFQTRMREFGPWSGRRHLESDNNYPSWHDHPSCEVGEIDREPGNRTYIIRHFNRPMSSTEVIVAAEREGCHVAVKEEGLAFTAAHKHLIVQERMPLAFLGSYVCLAKLVPFKQLRSNAYTLGSGFTNSHYGSIEHKAYRREWGPEQRFLLVRR